MWVADDLLAGLPAARFNLQVRSAAPHLCLLRPLPPLGIPQYYATQIDEMPMNVAELI